MLSEGYLGPFRGFGLSDWAEALVVAGRHSDVT